MMAGVRAGIFKFAFVIAMLWVVVEPLGAHPNFLADFKNDPFRRADVDGCAVCHVNSKGGGTRNEFGMAYEDAANTFTPMMRASFPDRFEVPTTKLADGSVLYLSDLKGQFVVYERNKKKFLFDLAAMTAPKKEVLAPKVNRMSFFVTSIGIGNGGHLGGLAGADQHCQSLAEAAGAGDRTWRAYLSTSFDGSPTVNAGDRIGMGPWFNARGVLIARGVADLHNLKHLNMETVLTEKGEVVRGSGEDANRIELLTGSNANGTAAVGLDCDNWTNSGDGKVMSGQTGPTGGDKGGSWNSGHSINSCSQRNFKAGGGEGRFYCFATK